MKTSTATKATAVAVPPTTVATAKAATLPATATTPVAAGDPGGVVVVVEWGGCLVLRATCRCFLFIHHLG